jgi:flagellar biosynthetic protein FliR
MDPAALPKVAGVELVAFVAVLARVGGLFVFAPVFSSRMIPPRVRLIAAGALSLALTPLAARGVEVPTDGFALAGMILKEAGVGLAISFAIGILAAAVQAAAALVDLMVGFSLAQVVDPFTAQNGAVFGQFYGVFVTMVIVVTGGDQLIVAGLADSYRIVPLDAYPDLGTLTGLASTAFVQVFALGLQISAPVVVALLVAEGAFALVARAVPQMNVFVVGMPAKIMLGMTMVIASLPVLAGRLQGQLESLVGDTLRALGP